MLILGGGATGWPVYLKYGFFRSKVFEDTPDEEPSIISSIVTS